MQSVPGLTFTSFRKSGFHFVNAFAPRTSRKIAIFNIHVDIATDRTLGYVSALCRKSAKARIPFHPYPQDKNAYHRTKQINKQSHRNIKFDHYLVSTVIARIPQPDSCFFRTSDGEKRHRLKNFIASMSTSGNPLETTGITS